MGSQTKEIANVLGLGAEAVCSRVKKAKSKLCLRTRRNTAKSDRTACSAK